MAKKSANLAQTRRQLLQLVAPEAGFLWIVVVYGVAISALTLAVPIAVQTLINTIANIGSLRAVYVLAFSLFLLLFISGLLSALRMWVIELFERHLFARLSAEMSYRVVRSPHEVFRDRRNAGITHRYFDIMTFQKNVPRLLVDGLTLVLQTLIGFTVVSFYHPWFLIFNLVILTFIYLIWEIWSRGAKITAIEMSREKYEMSRWLSDLETAHEFFKSSRHVELAAETTDDHSGRFIKKHREHFSFTFKQAVGFLLLYAFSSSMLLGLGGWLVTNGELSIGQLVSAELIMASIFLGLSRFSSFLKYYYELFGATDKIMEVLTLPQESSTAALGTAPESGALVLDNVAVRRGNRLCHISCDLKSGEKRFVSASEPWIQRQLTQLLNYHEPVREGQIVLGGKALGDLDRYELRQTIHCIDRSLIVQCSIREFLNLACDGADTQRMITALESVGLWQVIQQFEDGLDTRLSMLGAPLRGPEMLLLKLAAAMLAQPKLVILNQRFDDIPSISRKQMLDLLQRQSFTILYFTSQPDADYFDGMINLEAEAPAQSSDNAAEVGNE